MPTKRHNAAGLLAAARERGMIRLRDARDLGFHPELLRRLVEAGSLVRVSRGVYGPADAEPSEHHSLAVVAARVPRGVVCLLSALRFHGLGTQDPAEVWLAVGTDDRLPAVRQPRVRAIRFAATAFSRGIDRHKIEGVPVRVYSPAKTVVDCLRMREEVGIDVALEALRDGLRQRTFARDDIWREAKALRVEATVRPYLEATT